MTTTVRTARTGAARRPPQWRRTAVWLIGIQGYMASWFFAVILTVAVLGVLIVSRYTGIAISVLGMGLHGAIWVPFSISIVIVASYLTPHVAAGMTRRSFGIGAVLAAVLTGALYTVVFIMLLAVERWVYSALGWRHASTTHDGLVFDPGVLTLAGGLMLLITSATVSGLLVGLFYYRLGAWWGTLTLPVSLAPLVLVSLLTLDPARQFTPWSVPFLTPSAQPLLGILIIVVAGVGVVLLARRVPIAAKEA